MGTSPTSEAPLRRDAQRNLERILDAAREAFAEEGVEVGVDEIARRAGVGVGTLYRRFPTKDALIDAIVARGADELASLAEEAEALEDPWEGLVLFLGGVLERQAHDRGVKTLLADRPPGERESVRARLRPRFARLVARAQEAGSLRGDVSAEDITVLVWGAGRALEVTGDIAPGQWRRHLGILLDGLRAERAAPLPGAPPTAEEGDALHAAWASAARSSR